MKILLKIGGIYHLLCAVMHLSFPTHYQWNERLQCLSPQDSAIIFGNLNIMSWCLLIFWLIFAYIPFFKTEDLLETSIGKILLTSIVLFWSARIFILQPIFFNFQIEGSIEQELFMAIGLVLFAIPWIKEIILKRN